MSKIIAFEGVDCSFKETNSKAYLDYLLSKGKKAKLFSFPRYGDDASHFVVEYLAGKYGKQEDLEPATIASFYMLDMFDCIQKEVKPLLKQDYTIIFDRYWYSNIYYRIALYRMYFKSNILEYNTKQQIENLANSLRLPKADVIVKLIPEEKVMLDFVHEKHSLDDIHESNDKFLATVLNIFSEINMNNYTTHGSFEVLTTINNKIRPKEDIFKSVLKGIDTLWPMMYK
jgi:thymidylate kinase